MRLLRNLASTTAEYFQTWFVILNEVKNSRLRSRYRLRQHGFFAMLRTTGIAGYRSLKTLPILFLGIFVSARALDWKTETLSVTTEPFQSELAVVFDFTNRGSKPVQIREIETSCSCLRADSDLKIYPPGASGKITANFAVGDRGGLYERGITVITDEPNSPARLVLRVEVPDLATVAPRSVDWQLNGPATEKSVDVTCAPGVEIDFSRTQSTSENFEVKVETVEFGKHYRLHLAPRSTDHVGSAAVRFYGRSKSAHEVVVSAYASVH